MLAEFGLSLIPACNFHAPQLIETYFVDFAQIGQQLLLRHSRIPHVSLCIPATIIIIDIAASKAPIVAELG